MNPTTLSATDVDALRSGTTLLWLNALYTHANAAPATANSSELFEAEARLQRFAPVLTQLFPELEASNGLIESPLLPVTQLAKNMDLQGGKLLLKADHALPVAGSIKARGGIHEVLCFAEALALQHGIIDSDVDDYLKLTGDDARALFSQYTVAVGSTGNLGLSIGIIGAALGFQAIVHMSTDAKAWKKTRLRDRGVTVVEHDADYGAAVAAGRASADADPKAYFVDDENSSKLFMGYAVAALRLQQQLQDQHIKVDAEHPLFVYLPAGVGGAPGGITYGLKQCFGPHVHCFMAEPVQAPCMLLGYASAAGSEPAPVYDYGLRINTDADGLAVGTASQWVCDATRDLVSGVFTATDAQLYQSLLVLYESENIEVEPSAAIACLGPQMLQSPAGQTYLEQHGLVQNMANAHHIAWLTGGSFVPPEEHLKYREKACSITVA